MFLVLRVTSLLPGRIQIQRYRKPVETIDKVDVVSPPKNGAVLIGLDCMLCE